MHLTAVPPLPDQPAVDRRLVIAARVASLRMNIVMRRTGDPVRQAAELDEITATIVEARNDGELYDDWLPVLDDLKACRIALSWGDRPEQTDQVGDVTVAMVGAAARIRPTQAEAPAAEVAAL